MRLPEFEYSHCRWDAYRQFYKSHRCFTQFENGGLGLRQGNFDPDERHVYEKFGVQIVSSADDNLPQLFTPEGAPVTKAWLNQGGAQTLIIDLEQKKAVRTWNYSPPKDLPVPQYARSFGMFWHGPGQDPVIDPKRPIIVQPPDNELKTASKTWEKEVRAACKVMAKIQAEQFYSTPSKFLLSPVNVATPVTEFVSQLTPSQIRGIATAGFEYPRAREEYPYLLIKE